MELLIIKELPWLFIAKSLDFFHMNQKYSLVFRHVIGTLSFQPILVFSHLLKQNVIAQQSFAMVD